MATNSRRIGLARALSKLGYCSRSQAVNLIRAGRVRVNGEVKRDPEFTLRNSELRLEVDGKIVSARQKTCLMLNKPRGIVTTASDEKGRTTVYSLLAEEYRPGEERWVAPVGRLDKASEGLLLLTNDSEWGARIVAPETHLEKTYHVQIGTVAEDSMIQQLVKGIRCEDGEILRAKRAQLLRAGEKNCWLEIVLEEGRNRQIRRMVDALRVKVLRLVRVAIGPLELGNLAKGESRPLSPEEKRRLDRAMGMKRS